MNIIEVMNSVKTESGYARRLSWKDGLLMKIDGHVEIINVKQNPNYESIYEFTCEDLSAKDWIIVEGKE